MIKKLYINNFIRAQPNNQNNQFIYFHPEYVSEYLTLSIDKKTVSVDVFLSSGEHNSAISGSARSSGKWYAEIVISHPSEPMSFAWGVADFSSPITGPSSVPQIGFANQDGACLFYDITSPSILKKYLNGAFDSNVSNLLNPGFSYVLPIAWDAGLGVLDFYNQDLNLLGSINGVVGTKSPAVNLSLLEGGATLRMLSGEFLNTPPMGYLPWGGA